ncbi:Macrolide export protein MacA [Myxococcaceae bacterium]|jgi:HlyD family secretion protein|nr:Macrolide export protein MacA [Myxococcaceae bacterium]
MTRRRRNLLIGVLASTGIGFGIHALANLRPIGVTAVRPENGVAVRVFGLGTVEARVVSKVGFEVGGALAELDVDHRDQIRRGDVLARLHSEEQQARVASAAAAVRAAEADVERAGSQVVRARAVLEQRRTTNQRRRALLDRDVVSRQSADEAQRDEDVAAAEVAVALAEVGVVQARLADARALLREETVLLEQHVLLAPFDGVVVERHREIGSVIGSGEVIFTLLAPETVWTLAYIDESRAGAIALGQKAEVRLRSLPHERYEATVVRIGLESDRANEERRVWLACDRCPEAVHLGEQAEVRIEVARLDRAILVPEAAVRDFDGTHATAWILRDGHLARTVLAFGHRTEDARLEVVGGLPDGARVVAEIVPGLREGRRARASEGDPS